MEVLGKPETLEEQVQKQIDLGRKVAEGFITRNPRLRFIDFAGLGRHGGALILEERGILDQIIRRFIIKYSLGDYTGDPYSNADMDLRNEHRWLRLLQGCEHIVQLVPFADCSLNLPGISNGERTYEAAMENARREDEARGTPGATSVRRYPTFALEYLQYGELRDFVDRLKAKGELVPNRILWRIWLCLVRQCVAMAFPIDDPDNPNTGLPWQITREIIRPDEEYFSLTQNSAHLENWLWGDQQASHDPDLIDFGRGQLELPQNWPEHGLDNENEIASRVNLFNAASVMTEICLPLESRRFLRFTRDSHLYEYDEDGQDLNLWTQAPESLMSAATMDLELRHILVRCMAERIARVPSLREALERAERAVANRGPYDDPHLCRLMNVDEDDDYILEFFQRFVYNPE
ncbi:hypothetical protein GQX73_g9752 [Xylaria multiplex]|uniref:Protein kinase domain-containing protein n=1 Tax=Xylaria multiplex TaxID=323545 RepID=A0A7C8MMI4_9PEZI|nr:hypothetical protein GQX73_g9752 [Xylaria multiplex]